MTICWSSSFYDKSTWNILLNKKVKSNILPEISPLKKYVMWLDIDIIILIRHENIICSGYALHSFISIIYSVIY